MMFVIFKAYKKKVKGDIFCFLMMLFLCITNLFAQQTNNLQVIWTIPGNPILRLFGHDLAHGDIDNDGHQDIIVSADTFTGAGPGISYRGRVYLFYGNNIGDTIPDVVFKSPFEHGSPRTRVHSTDLNGDGFDDIIMGQGEADSGFGKVTVFLGGNPVDTIPDIILSGSHGWPIFDGLFGDAISSGDVNGDGYSDLIIGSLGTSIQPVGNLAGRVYIYFGSPNFNTIPDVILNGGHNGQAEDFGTTVGSGADVNGDGYDDVIVGAPSFSSGSFWGEGRIYIYYGGNPMDTSYDVAMLGEVPNENLGWTPTVNLVKTESQYDMAVFGSGFWPYGFPREGPGKVYVLFGGNPMDSIPDVCMIGRTETTSLGRRVSNAGFVNGTNSEAIISGAPPEYNEIGTAYLWLGGILLDTTPNAWLRGLQYDDAIGWCVASAGDIDSDGRDEIMVSNYASNYSPKKVWVCKYTGTGIEENYYPPPANHLPFEVYPNPVRSVLRVRCPLFVEEIKIYDITGKIVKTFDKVDSRQNTEHREIRWDLRDDKQTRIANGIYFLEVIAKDNGKIIRQTKKIEVVK